MSVGGGLAAAVLFFWLGLVCAISFVEAPLKFRAPGVTLAIGLGIGRRVFRALNTLELVAAVLVVVAAFLSPLPCAAVVAGAVAIVALLAQVIGVRPFLTKRSDAVLAGTADESTRSRAHFWYLGLELVKVVALLVAGVVVLAGG